MPVLYQQHAVNMLVTCWQHADNMLTACWQHFGNMPVTKLVSALFFNAFVLKSLRHLQEVTLQKVFSRAAADSVRQLKTV